MPQLSSPIARRPSAPPPRDRILTAIARVIANDGYANSKVIDIARGAHVSLRTFYDAFENKEGAFLELHRVLVERIADALEAAVTFDGEWRDAMRQGFDQYFRLLLAQPKLTMAIMLEVTTLGEPGYEAREYGRERFAGLLCGLVEQGRAAYPEIPSRALTPLMARSVLGAVLELVMSGVADEGDEGDEDPLPELVDTATDLLWRLVVLAP